MFINRAAAALGENRGVRAEASDEVWSVIEPLLPPVQGKGRTWSDHRLTVEGMVCARGIKATIPERNDQIAHRRKRPGLPIDFGPDQRERYRARSDVERCFSRLKQWRGIAMRTGETARSHNTAITLPRS